MTKVKKELTRGLARFLLTSLRRGRIPLGLDITGLTPGKHRVFVSGWDMEGMLGSPDSIDTEITE
ncbi:MAG: hypothetical protein ABIM74_01250 [candidate division WOR-3 bacterium]